MKRKRPWAVGATALVLSLLLGGTYTAYRLGLIFPPSGATPLVQPDPSAAGAKAKQQTNRINILLMGIDARTEGEQTRSDIMILLSVDPETKDVSMLSIPRDSRVEIPGHGLDKINHAHAFGGAQLAMQTVADNFKVPIHHWARIDMPGMLKLLDVVGPVSINVPEPLTVGGKQLSAGVHSMDSEMALAYLRERHTDTRGDIGRTERSQDFILAVMKQTIRNVGVTDLPRVFSIYKQYVETDMEIRDLPWRSLASADLSAANKGTVKGHGVMIDGIYYYQVDWAETEKVLTAVHLHE